MITPQQKEARKDGIMEKPCYYVKSAPPNECGMCECAGLKKGYKQNTNVLWDVCQFGRLYKHAKAKVIAAAVMNEIVNKLQSHEPGSQWPIHHIMNEMQELDLTETIDKLL